RSLVDTRNDAMAAAVSARTGADSCDLVVASEVDMVPYVREAPGVPALLEDLELTALRDRIQRVALPHRRVRAVLTWLKLAGYVRCVLPRFSACTVVSNSEAKLLKSVVPDYPFVRVIPNAVNLSDYRGDFGQPSPDTMVFAGAVTYSANYDAVGHFLKDIYPRIARGVPNASLRITGSTTGVDVGSLPARQGVTFTGHVDDVRPVVARSWLSVVPLRVGGGTRLKILESMALGTPVVSTTKGAEGLEVTNGENIAVADPPDLFADCAIELMQSAQLRARLTAGGRALVESRYSWSIVGTQLNELVEQVVSGLRPDSSHSGVCGVSVG
ncbi:MAG TPA: glycosyltransferase, partial [Chloroflexota bacterium]|nr:glycosyltransferase [Chloroflexota bacterium]